MAEHTAADMPLQDWLSMFNDIYFVSQNYERSEYQMLSHVVEVVGRLARASTKSGDFTASMRYLAKTLAWFSALLRALSIGDFEQILWNRYPGRCPYCLQRECRCSLFASKPPLDIRMVRDTALRNRSDKPRDLYGWQQMFDDIYDQSGRRAHGTDTAAAQETLLKTFGRLVEELGEVSEAMRLQPFYPLNLHNEVADLFAWICAVANVMPLAFGRNDVMYLADVAWAEYPNSCPSCGNAVCTCRPEPVRQAISRAGVYASEGYDDLTGLWSRGKFDHDFPRVARAPRGGQVALLMIDCDNFKAFNDQAPGGHAQGDVVLQAIAVAIRDAVPPAASLYRRGGDEFIVVLQAGDVNAAEVIAGRIASAVDALRVDDITGSGTIYRPSVSLGVAIGGTDLDVNMALHSIADEDMYRQKRAKAAAD